MDRNRGKYRKRYTRGVSVKRPRDSMENEYQQNNHEGRDRGRGGRNGGNRFGGRSNGSGGGHGGSRKLTADNLVLTEEFILYVAAQLKPLKDDPTIKISFPSTLDNEQRMYIHILARKSGFHSFSFGKGDNRYISVSGRKTSVRMGNSGGNENTISMRAPPTQLDVPELTLNQMREFLKDFPSAPLAESMAPPLNETPQRSSFRTMPKVPKKSHSYDSNQLNLPAYAHRNEILELSRAHQVVVIAGDTGCGKSTQIPQYLLDDGAARVVVTQPRRISAITLAQRIAEERAVRIGSDVGYSVRLDSRYDSATTRLILCTTGVLLNWLSTDPSGRSLTHIVVDEVHERDKQIDFLLVCLRLILPERPDLRVILMSATIQVDKFSAYFQGCPTVHIQGRMYPVLPCYLDDVLLLLNDKVEAKLLQYENTYDLKCVMCGKTSFSSEEDLGIHVATCFGTEWLTENELPEFSMNGLDIVATVDDVQVSEIQGSVCDQVLAVLEAKKKNIKKHEIRAMLSRYQSTQDAISMDGGVDIHLVVQLLQHLLRAEYGNGAILVFLPGWEDIRSINEQLTMDSTLMATTFVTMLHSKLPSAEQKKAFQLPPRGMRKVILTTNIAETSVTISDVVYVIDTGKSKQSSLVNGFTSLKTEWISQANCSQRKGRAGRVAPGVCFHLMSPKRFNELAPVMTPELLATSLDEIVLNILLLQYNAKGMLGFDTISMFLHLALDPPSDYAIATAIESLQTMGALDSDEELTYLGWKLAQLAVSPSIGKMILFGHFINDYDCLLYTCCALSYQDPFVSNLGMPASQRTELRKVKQALGNTTSSDHLIVYSAMRRYVDVKGYRNGNVRMFCSQNLLVPSTLEHIFSVVKQIKGELEALGYAAPPPQSEPNLAMAQAVLAAGLYPNVMYRRAGKNFTTKEKMKVKLAGETVLTYPNKSDEITDWICSHDVVQSERGRSARASTKVSPLSLAIFVGKHATIEDTEVENEAILVVDDWIVLATTRDTAEILLAIRQRFHAAFSRHLHHSDEASSHDRQLVRALQVWISRQFNMELDTK